MLKENFIGAIDQGTTSTRFVIFDKKGTIKSIRQIEHKQIYPKPGWVEHNPVEIIDNTFKVMKEALKKAELKPQNCSYRHYKSERNNRDLESQNR